MKKVFSATTTLLLLSLLASTPLHAEQERTDTIKQVELDEVIVSAIRVQAHSSVAHSNIDEQSLKANNTANNIPALMELLPSVVAYTEGGTSVGNSSFRVRGTDANRINMTLNGMPLNNPETQEVYWVNLPDLSSSLKSIQLQRGVGSATAGTASFGGSVSMQSVGARPSYYADYSAAYGHYNTFATSLAAGTGLLTNGLSVDARYSYTRSDGYIRNGKVDHRNLYLSASHYGERHILKLIYINGIQHSGITWGGVSPEKKREDRRYNAAGEYVDDAGVTRYYDNETDNYYSNIAQAQYSHYLSRELTLNLNFGYNNGYGYYENYKKSQEYSEFGLPNQVVNGVEHEESDVIRRKLMSNDLYSGGVNLVYRGARFEAVVGANYTFFDGDHYGRLLWVKYNANVPENYQWYENRATKRDFNNFVKLSYEPVRRLVFEVELQGRFVDYTLRGVDDDGAALSKKSSYMFFNPKAGLSYCLNNHLFYASFALSNREPLRADLKESIKGNSPRPIKSERLYDYEFGWRYVSTKLQVATNFYYMDYQNQFVQTGRLSDTGYKFQENVRSSFRYGVELEAGYNPLRWLGVGANLSLSRNKIENYTAYYDYYDNPTDYNWIGQTKEFHRRSDISFSPNIVAAMMVRFNPIDGREFDLNFTGKYVGRFYYDNTSNRDNRLPAHFVANFQVSYSVGLGVLKKLTMQFMVNNLFNRLYDANARVSTDRFANGEERAYKGLFPQAGTNVMGRLILSF